MSDFTYWIARAVCYPVFWMTSTPLVLHPERARLGGSLIVACNHLSPFETPLLIRHMPRCLDFMSVVEMRRILPVALFYSLFNTFYVDRGKSDVAGAREAVTRLRRGRAVAMFPEGNIRESQASVVNGGSIRPGVARLAELSGAPILPVVVLGSQAYNRIANWLPTFSVRYGIVFGEVLRLDPRLSKRAAQAEFLEKLTANYRALASELRAALGHGAAGTAADGTSDPKLVTTSKTIDAM